MRVTCLKLMPWYNFSVTVGGIGASFSLWLAYPRPWVTLFVRLAVNCLWLHVLRLVWSSSKDGPRAIDIIREEQVILREGDDALVMQGTTSPG